MGDQSNNHSKDVGGIKLFGTTISLEMSAKAIKEEAVKKRSLGDHDDRDQDDQDRTAEMKRPEKIIACPRCKSMETKFCYFNNYNVNQPRHFCKGCQRYWTAGGALRNVPVGAGRRKAKPPGPADSHYHRDHDVASFDFDVQEWHVAVQGGFRQVFPVVKRQRSGSGSQTTTCAYS